MNLPLLQTQQTRKAAFCPVKLFVLAVEAGATAQWGGVNQTVLWLTLLQIQRTVLETGQTKRSITSLDKKPSKESAEVSWETLQEKKSNVAHVKYYLHEPESFNKAGLDSFCHLWYRESDTKPQ